MNLEEKIIELLKKYKKLNKKDMRKLIRIDKTDFVPLDSTLKKLIRIKIIFKDKLGRYYLPATESITGRMDSVKNKYAFFISDSGERLYIPGDKLMGAMQNDQVKAVKTGQKGSDQGEIVDIVSRANEKVVGTIINKRGEIFLAPDDYRLNFLVKLDKTEGLPENFKAVAQISSFYQDGRNPEGKITEILGEGGKPGPEMLSVIRAHNIPDTFPQEVLDEADKIPEKLLSADIIGREDLRNFEIFTIDGIDAKDLDDAISIKMENGLYILGVHIADVSHYVRPDSAIDGEAFRRGTSVYFPGSVIPMLPKRLSNGICSLNPNADRLALSCEMKIDNTGQVREYRIFKSVIRSCERLVYDDINKLFEGEEALIQRYSHIYDSLICMKELMDILKRRRKERGSIDFDTDEPEFMLDADGKAVDVRIHQRGLSNMMIEEFMLICNETVAGHMRKNELPALYRIHEKPDKSKTESFLNFIKGYGYGIKEKELDKPADYARLLDKIKGRPEEKVISRLMLRSMQKAKYSENNLGHFGLAAEDYLHFTSPIRRYPDLLVHRMIHFSMEKSSALTSWAKRIPAAAVKTSERERAAQEAERDADDIKKAEYMQDHIGEEYNGIISGMCATAFWVELDNTVEGMVPLASVKGDFYVFDDEKYMFIGRRTGKKFKLGQSVRIKVAGASVRGRSITFELIGSKKN